MTQPYFPNTLNQNKAMGSYYFATEGSVIELERFKKNEMFKSVKLVSGISS